MSTSRTINNLNIRKFSNKAAFDSATIGEDDICVLLDDGTPLMYTTTLPEPSASVVNAVYYLISDYQGQAGWYQGQRIYKCIFDGSNYYWSSLYTQENTNYGSRYSGTLTVSSTRTAFRFTYSSILPLGGFVVQMSDGMGSDFVAVIVGDADVYRQTTIKATGAFAGMRLGTYKTSTTLTYRYYILTKKDNSTFFDSSTRVTYTVTGLGNDANTSEYGRISAITISSTVEGTRTWFEEISGSQTTDMPEITPDILGQTRQYTGATDSTYTNGYFYKATGTEVITPAVMAATITSPSGEATVDIDAASFIRNFCNWAGWSVADLERNLISSAQQAWMINYSIDDARVIEVFTPFYGWVGAASITQCFAVTYTGASSSGNIDINFTVAYTPSEHTVQDGAWERVDVQPAGATYSAGNGISIDANNEISVADPVLTNKATGRDSVTIGGTAGYPSATSNTVVGVWSNVGYNQASVSKNNVVVGNNSRVRNGDNDIVIGCNAGDGSTSSMNYGIAIGAGAKYNANYAIQLGGNAQTNSDANTFKVANANGNFEIMSADGTIPEARLADTTNAQQGDVLTLDSTGNAVWQAGGGGNCLPLTGGTLTGIITQDIGTSGWADFVAVKNTSYPNNPTVLQVQSSTTSSLGFRVKNGGNITLSSVYGIGASDVAGAIGAPTSPFGSISVEKIYARGGNYNYPITVPQNTTGTMVVATPPTTPNTTWVLKATVDANGDCTVAWVQEV